MCPFSDVQVYYRIANDQDTAPQLENSRNGGGQNGTYIASSLLVSVPVEENILEAQNGRLGRLRP